MHRSNITAIITATLVLVGLTGFVSSATQSAGAQIQLCVNTKTKEVKYSKGWTSCPKGHTPVSVGQIGPQGLPGVPGAQGPQGLMGPSGPGGANGTTRSLWDSLDNCYKKLQAALLAGYKMHYKADRNSFESQTGCIVENIRDTELIASYEAAGLPVIKSWKFIRFEDTEYGDDSWGVNHTGRAGIYEFEVANFDYISKFWNGTVVDGSQFYYCAIQALGNFQQVDGAKYQHAAYVGTDNEMKIEIQVGIGEWTCRDVSNVFPGLTLVIYEDPQKILDNPGWRSDTTQVLELWGWN